MEVTAAEIRSLVDRPVTQSPVTSVYLNTDGARFPRSADYLARLDALLRDVRKEAEQGPPEHAAAVTADLEQISRFMRDDFQRDGVRGVGLFASDGEIFATVQVAIGVRNIARCNATPYVVPLEALLSRHHHIGLVVIERDKARIFRHRLGNAEEWVGLESDVHGQHDQGGWSQARYQRNIENEVLAHFKEAAEVLRKAHEDDAFDAIVVAGPHAEALDFTRQLHPYVAKLVHGEPMSLAPQISADEVETRLADVEQELVSSRRAGLLQRLAAAQGQAEKAARGVRHVVEASNEKRIEVLFVVEGAGVPGYKAATGALALREQDAAAYGKPVTPVTDLIDELIEEAVRASAHIELFRDESRLDGHPVAALLRF